MGARTTKAPAAPKAQTEAKLGEFSFEKETPNNHRFVKVLSSEDERGANIYVPKDVLAALANPETIEVIVRTA